MSRLILAMQTSIDGYVDSSLPDAAWQLWNWGPDWPWSEDLRASFNRLLAEASGILLSRPMAATATWRTGPGRRSSTPTTRTGRSPGPSARSPSSR
nr:dihydrofolate reductase family protein [Streptomyces sp. TLI_235]